MNIVEETPDRLVLQVRPNRSYMIAGGMAAFGLVMLVWGWFLDGGCVMLMIGAAVLPAALGTTLQEPVQTLTLDRPANRLRVEVKAIGGQYRWKANIDYITKFEVQSGSLREEATLTGEEADSPNEHALGGSWMDRFMGSRHVMLEFKDGVRRGVVRHVENDPLAREIAAKLNDWVGLNPAG